jgi:hypothetical protein
VSILCKLEKRGPSLYIHLVKPQQTDAFWLEWCLDELKLGRDVKFVSKGLSMFPVMMPKQEIVISNFPIESIKVGQLLAFKRQTHIVVHRVVKVLENPTFSLRTQGDANWRMDEPITTDNYIGLVSLKGKPERQSRFAILFYKPIISFWRIGLSIGSKTKKLFCAF